MNKWIREPLVQFLLIGAAIYGLYALYGQADESAADKPVIVVSNDQVDSLAAAFARRWNRPPTEAEMQGLLRGYVKESLLYREALAMGLDEDDHIVRRRMAQKLEFLTSDLARMRRPTDEELEAYFEANRSRYENEDLVSFSQVFLDPHQRGINAEDQALEIRSRLQAAGAPTADSLPAGDSNMLQQVFTEATRLDVSRQLGGEFTETVMALEPGSWYGPISSGYGMHLVWVDAFTAAEPPQLEAVRETVSEDWLREQTEEFNQQYVETLAERYEVVLENEETGAE